MRIRRWLLLAPVLSGCGLGTGSPYDGPAPKAIAEVQVVDLDGGALAGVPVVVGGAREDVTDDGGYVRFEVSGSVPFGEYSEGWEYGASVSLAGAEDAGWATARSSFYGMGFGDNPVFTLLPIVRAPRALNVQVDAGVVTASTQLDFGLTTMRVCAGSNLDAGFADQACTVTDYGKSRSVELRALEDFGGWATGQTVVESGSGGHRTLYLSQHTDLPLGDPAPSRGAACAVDGAPLDPCPLTDGVLGVVTFPSRASELTFALGQPRTLTRMFARGLGVVFRDAAQQTTARWTVEGSANGATWDVLAELRGAQQLPKLDPVELAPVGQVKQVRIRSDSDAGFELIYSNEVSFW